MIPISLYVIIEMLKICMAKSIDRDVKMFFAEEDDMNFANTRNSDLIEELGQVEFVFSDKTGTLTTNQMSVSAFFVVATADKGSCKLGGFKVEGDTYSPRGAITTDDDKPADMTKDPTLEELATVCSLCNASSLEYVDLPPLHQEAPASCLVFDCADMTSLPQVQEW